MSWKWTLFLVLFLVAGCFSVGEKSATEQLPLMSKEDLRASLGSPDIVLLDVRQPIDWSYSDSKITGANWEDPRYFSKWQDKYPKDKTLVLYCA